ncbi:TIGR03899 family protein [Alteromonas sp. V450]|nr:TIGR03899 family protein [Alteromonas sp. V450]
MQGKEVSNDKPVPAPPANEKIASNTQSNTSQQRMLSWFARVGISPSMLSPDPKKQKHALERRKQILETQKASNLQAVLNIALNVSINEQTSDNLDPDWFFAFSTMAEEIYSPPMQELWGKIFAVEVARPGSFSLRTLQLLKTLTHRDAKIFNKAVNVASRKNSDTVPRILVGYHKRKGLFSFLKKPLPEQVNLASVGLSYPDLLSLQEMKLIYASEIESGEYAEGQQVTWRCVNENITLTCKTAGVALVYYKFTPVGSELYKLVTKSSNEAYLQALKQVLGEVFNIS